MARMISGTGIHVDYTPSSPVANGDLIVQGNTVRFADSDIAANVKGALVVGGVVIGVPKDTGSSSAIGVGLQLYWDAGNEVATPTSSTHKKLGVSAAAAAASDDEVLVVLGQVL